MAWEVLSIDNQSTIPQNAQVPFSYKVSAFIHFRAFTVCSPDQLISELNKMHDIARIADIKKAL